MSSTPLERAANITQLMLQVLQRQRRAMTEWVTKLSDLTPEQSRYIGFIEAHQANGLIAREIAEFTGRSAATIATTIQTLEELGYVKRTPSPTDSRQKLISLSERGEQLHSGYVESMREADLSIYQALSEDEQEQLIALLEKIAIHSDTNS